MKENKDALKGKKAIKCEPVDWNSFKMGKEEPADRNTENKKAEEKWAVGGTVEKKKSDKDFNEFVFKELSADPIEDGKTGEGKKGSASAGEIKEITPDKKEEPVKKERKRKSLNTKLEEINSSNWVSTGNFRNEENISDKTIKELEDHIIETTKAVQDEVLSSAVDEVNKALRDENGYEPLGEVSLGDTFEIPELDIHFGDTEELKGIDRLSREIKDKDLKKEIEKLDLAQSIEAQTAKEIAEQEDAEKLDKELRKKKRKKKSDAAAADRLRDTENAEENRPGKTEGRRKKKTNDDELKKPEGRRSGRTKGDELKDPEGRSPKRTKDGRPKKTRAEIAEAPEEEVRPKRSKNRRSEAGNDIEPGKTEGRRSRRTEEGRVKKTEGENKSKRRKNSEDKVIIRSDELKEKRKKKKSASAKGQVPEKKSATSKKRTAGADDEVKKSARKMPAYAGKKGDKISDKLDGVSEFRKKSAEWKDDDLVKEAEKISLFEQRKKELKDRIKKVTPLQWSMAAMALIIFITGIMTSAVYANYQGEQNKARALASLTQYTEDESYLAATETVTEEMLPQAAEEPEQVQAKVLSLEMTSVEKDLKIKLVDEEDTLVKDVTWSVTVTGESEDGEDTGESQVYEDDDRDGTIYINDIAAGEYAVTLNPSDSLADYILPQEKQLVSVKATIEYKVIANIRDEIKTEKEVNVALEDPNGNQAADVETGAAVADTVEWCESTKTANGEEYVEATPDISKTAASMKKNTGLFTALEKIGRGSRVIASNQAALGFSLPVGYKVAIVDEGGELEITQDPTETPTPTPTPNPDEYRLTISADSDTINAGSTVTVKVKDKNPSDLSIEWELSGDILDKEVASLESNGDSCRVTGKDEGVVIVKAKGSNVLGFIWSNDIRINVKKENNDDTSLSISGSNSVTAGSTVTLTASFKPDDSSVSWETSDNTVAYVDSTEDNGKTCRIKAEKAGSVTITAKCSNGKSTTMTLTVSDINANYSDDAKLYDASKNPLYVKELDGYRLATYGDYKSSNFQTYYRKQESYLYTGWQTIEGKTYYYTSDHNYVTGDQIIQGIKYSFGSDGALATGSGTLGIDVSKYQPNINWSAVKASGVSYVIIRCGYRGASTGALIQDPYFTSHIKGAKAAGLKVGVYFFTTALTEAEAVEEASMCAALCSGYGINYPIFMDCENSPRPGYNSMSASERTTIIKAFCNTIKSAGYTPGVYANKTWFSSYINTSALSGCKIWLAQYNSSGPTYSGHYDLWQYTSKGHVDGISGNVDMNQSYLGY